MFIHAVIHKIQLRHLEDLDKLSERVRAHAAKWHFMFETAENSEFSEYIIMTDNGRYHLPYFPISTRLPIHSAR